MLTVEIPGLNLGFYRTKTASECQHDYQLVPRRPQPLSEDKDVDAAARSSCAVVAHILVKASEWPKSTVTGVQLFPKYFDSVRSAASTIWSIS